MRRKRLEPVGRREATTRSSRRARSSRRRSANGRARGHRLRPAHRSAAAPELGLGARGLEGVQLLERHSGRPNRRSRATPPSGKMFRRTCVTPAIDRSVLSKPWRESACSGVRGSSSCQSSPGAAAVHTSRLHAAGRVALEMPRVHLDARNRAARAKPHDRPVVAGRPPPPGFPAVRHAARGPRHDEVVAPTRRTCRCCRRRAHRARARRDRSRLRRRSASQSGVTSP